MTTRFRILAVDDNEDTLELIRMTLHEVYDVLTLSNPMDIYELLELFEPDLLILDIMMPKITGFQLVEMLQKNSRTRNLPIIVLSAKDGARDIKHGYKLGASLYLTKPFQPDRLLKNVHTQFEVHPPKPRPKALTVEQVNMQLQLKPSFKQGYARLSSTELEDEGLQRTKEDELRERFSRRGRP
ncbi:response regulator [Candidatus Poribacteria bacterium]|nr:response regulator [Candidatus Poribacteria bacterium]